MTIYLKLVNYNKLGDTMTVYVDLVFFINFIMDFYILSGVKFILKKKTKFVRIIFGSLIGSLSLLILFFDISMLVLNIFKIIISILMIYVTFGKKKILYNLFYLYVVSIIVGGSLYLINDTFGYGVNGFLFINNGYSINLVVLLVISPVVISFYVLEFIKYRKMINTIYSVVIKFRNYEVCLDGFLDTGNKLVDPYFRRPIVLVNRKCLRIRDSNYIYVPFNSLNNNGLLKCIMCEYILVNNKKYRNILIGVSDNLNIDCILNERLISYEENY